MRPDQYLKLLINPIFSSHKTTEIYHYNPAEPPQRKFSDVSDVYVYHYDGSSKDEFKPTNIKETFHLRDSEKTSWINVDGICKSDVETICRHFGIHSLLVEDIISVGQRPKMDDIEGVLFCLLNMLYFNDESDCVEQEQISVVMGKNFVITFQEDAHRDVFKSLREKMNVPTSRLRQRGPDYLCYSILDMIVDHYFEVMDKLGSKIERLEEEIVRNSTARTLVKLNHLRKEPLVLKRNVAPVRDLVNGFLKSESELLEEKVFKYFKDVYDHIIQANDVAEDYRNIMTGLQDLYISQVNLKMNEVMKVLALVTCLLAPAAVIGGIFGMNFDVIPYAHQKWGFYITVALMFLIPLMMLGLFKRRGWF